MVREVFGLPEIWRQLQELDNQVPTDAQHIGYREVRRTVDRAVRWLIDLRFPISDVATEIERFKPIVDELAPKVLDLLRGRERENRYAEVDRLIGHGLPRELAMRITNLLTSFLLLDVVEIAVANDRSTGRGRRPALRAVRTAQRGRSAVGGDRSAPGGPLVGTGPGGHPARRLRRAGRDHHRGAEQHRPDLLATERLAQWAEQNPERIERARTTFAEALSRDPVDLATLSVALRVMRSLPV